MLRDRRSHRFGRDVGGQEAQPVDVRVDLAGRGRERDVAVVAGVRRDGSPGRGRGARSRRAAGTRAWCSGVGGDDGQRGVGLLLERVGPRGTPGGPSGALDPAIIAPSRAEHVADRVHHHQRADHDVAVARARANRAHRAPRTRRRATCRRSRRDPRRPARSGADRRLAQRGGERGRVPPPFPGSDAAGRRRDRRSRRRGRAAPAHPAWGTRGRARPAPASRRRRSTSPNAEPPDSTIASTCCDGATGFEQRGLPGGRRAAADLGRRGGVGWEHDHGDTGDVAGPVPDADAGNVGDHCAAARPLRMAASRGASRAKSRMSWSTSAARSYMSM